MQFLLLIPFEFDEFDELKNFNVTFHIRLKIMIIWWHNPTVWVRLRLLCPDYYSPINLSNLVFPLGQNRTYTLPLSQPLSLSLSLSLSSNLSLTLSLSLLLIISYIKIPPSKSDSLPPLSPQLEHHMQNSRNIFPFI